MGDFNVMQWCPFSLKMLVSHVSFWLSSFLPVQEMLVSHHPESRHQDIQAHTEDYIEEPSRLSTTRWIKQDPTVIWKVATSSVYVAECATCLHVGTGYKSVFFQDSPWDMTSLEFALVSNISEIAIIIWEVLYVLEYSDNSLQAALCRGVSGIWRGGAWRIIPVSK